MAASPNPDFFRQKRAILAELLALAREVYHSREFESELPGGRHTAEFVETWRRLRPALLADPDQAPCDTFFLRGSVFDLGNIMQCLDSYSQLGRVEARDPIGWRSPIYRLELAEGYLESFTRALEYLINLDRWLAEREGLGIRD